MLSLTDTRTDRWRGGNCCRRFGLARTPAPAEEELTGGRSAVSRESAAEKLRTNTGGRLADRQSAGRQAGGRQTRAATSARPHTTQVQASLVHEIGMCALCVRHRGGPGVCASVCAAHRRNSATLL